MLHKNFLKISILFISYSCAIYSNKELLNETKSKKIEISKINLENDKNNSDSDFPYWENKIDEAYISNKITINSKSTIKVNVTRKQLNGLLNAVWGGFSLGSLFIIPYQSSNVEYEIICEDKGIKKMNSFEYSHWISIFLLFKSFSFNPSNTIENSIINSISICISDLKS